MTDTECYTKYDDPKKQLRLYSGGTFDIPHLGHYNFFRLCKELFPDSYLIVALNRDDFIEKYKGRKPVFNYLERLRLLSFVEYIDQIVPNFGDSRSTLTIDQYKPDIIVIGSDWLQKNYCKQMGFDAQWLRDRNISLIYLPYTEGISTTEIKKRIGEG